MANQSNFGYYYNDTYAYASETLPQQKEVDPVKLLGFPLKIHEMLSRPELNHIVSWMPHGRAWKIHKPKAFEEKVVPLFFFSCKYSSFVRQANGWGFRRICKGLDRNAYYHRFFLRGRLDLCRLMKRPGVRQKVTATPENEPDFYKMPLIEEDNRLFALDVLEGSGNRAVKKAAEIYSEIQRRTTKEQSQIPVGDIFTLDAEDESYKTNSDPLSHYEAQLKLSDKMKMKKPAVSLSDAV